MHQCLHVHDSQNQISRDERVSGLGPVLAPLSKKSNLYSRLFRKDEPRNKLGGERDLKGFHGALLGQPEVSRGPTPPFPLQQDDLLRRVRPARYLSLSKK